MIITAFRLGTAEGQRSRSAKQHALSSGVTTSFDPHHARQDTMVCSHFFQSQQRTFCNERTISSSRPARPGSPTHRSAAEARNGGLKTRIVDGARPIHSSLTRSRYHASIMTVHAILRNRASSLSLPAAGFPGSHGPESHHAAPALTEG